MSACPAIPIDEASVSTASNTMAGTVPVVAGKPFKFHGINETLIWDGQRLYIEQNNVGIADGEYTKFSIVNGAISSAGQAPLASYTPGICG
jgi:hypothetical protein